MPAIIKHGKVVDDNWSGLLLTVDELNTVDIATIDQAIGVVLQPDQPPSSLDVELSTLSMVAINFPQFTDGRCFSYARELRELGFDGEIRATGHFIRDQLFYLHRCGFDAYQFADETDLEAAVGSLSDFSDAYQASVDQPKPLFLRRN
jgi:uncharacterized protein (DUF934 family)